MISCTEFIPSYSELFTYIEDNYGKEAVRDYWEYLFHVENDDDTPLAKCLAKAGGIKGCFDYWTCTLNEEAADFTMYLNEKAGWFCIDMHYCPSKGRLLEAKEKYGLEPYPDYCLHCNYYRRALERAGLNYTYNFINVDRAACIGTVTDPKVFDGRMIVDENTLIMDRKAADNEYFHRGFHSSLNKGMEYLATKYSEEDISKYLTAFTKHVYGKDLEVMKKEGLAALEKFIHRPYDAEHCEDACVTKLSADGKKLDVEIRYCPAVKFFHENGEKVSDWYQNTTIVVMDTLAKEIGAKFNWISYDKETGAAKYSFEK